MKIWSPYYKVNQKQLKDCGLTVREIVLDMTISIGSVHFILTENLCL